MVATVAIPWLTGQAINGLETGDEDELRRYALLVVAAAVVRLGLAVARRLVAGRVSLAIEFDLRNLLYRHLQALELAFFDRQQTGQLMSRATVDLQSVRFFLGYGLIFITQSALTIVLAAVAMFLLQPELAALSLIPVPFVVLIAARFGHRSRPALQEVQQRIAELTADVEENVSGVRVVKAFAAEPRQLARFGDSAGARVRPVDDGHAAARVLHAAHRVPAEHRPGGDPARRRPPGHRRTAHARRLHRLLRLPADADRADAPAGHRARARPAGDRIRRAAVRAARPHPGARRRRPARRRSRPGAARSSCATSASATAARRRPRCATSTCASRPGRRSRSSAPPARARRRWSRSSRGSTTSRRARC